MKITRPEEGIERLLAALEQDLLAASDEEIAVVAGELGIKPGMKGSIALFGVTQAVRFTRQGDDHAKRRHLNKDRQRKAGLRRRPKGDAPPST